MREPVLCYFLKLYSNTLGGGVEGYWLDRRDNFHLARLHIPKAILNRASLSGRGKGYLVYSKVILGQHVVDQLHDRFIRELNVRPTAKWGNYDSIRRGLTSRH